MTAQSIFLLGLAILLPLTSLAAEATRDRQRLRDATIATWKARKAELEKVTKLGPEKMDEIVKALGIQDPAALFQLQEFRKVRAEIIALQKANRPEDEAKIKALEERRDTYATGVFEQFEAILTMLRNRIKADERQLARLDGIWVPEERK